jgi:tetratricopeptide (TPR) repeat protein
LAGSAAAVLILGAMAFALWSAGIARRERARAEERFRDVRRIAHKVLHDYPQALQKLSAATELQVRMAADSLEYLNVLARAKSSDPELLLELADGYIETGRLLGMPRLGNLGRRREALQAFQSARSILEDLLKQHPDLQSARAKLAVVLNRLSQVDSRNSGELARRSLALWEDLYHQDPTDKATLSGLGLAHIRLAEMDHESRHAEVAIGRLDSRLAQDPGDPNVTTALAYAHRLAAQHYLAQDDPARALDHAQTAKTMDERATALVSDRGVYRMEMSLDLHLIAMCHLRRNELAGAREFFERANLLRRAVYKSNPRDEWVQHRFLEGLGWLGWVEEQQADWPSARRTYREAANLAATLTASQPDDEWNAVLGFAYGSEGLMIRRREGRTTAACGLFQRSASHFRAVKDFLSPIHQRRAAEVEREGAACK